MDNESRRNTYRSWLNSEKGQQDRKLYNACSKALAICEATAEAEESERLKIAQQAAKNWDAANLGNNRSVSQSSTVQQPTTTEGYALNLDITEEEYEAAAKNKLKKAEQLLSIIQIMSTKKNENKTADTWTTKADEIFTKYGLKRNFENKTGSCIMPAPKHLQSVKQQQKSKNQEAEGSKEAKQNG